MIRKFWNFLKIWQPLPFGVRYKVTYRCDTSGVDVSKLRIVRMNDIPNSGQFFRN